MRPSRRAALAAAEAILAPSRPAKAKGWRPAPDHKHLAVVAGLVREASQCSLAELAETVQASPVTAKQRWATWTNMHWRDRHTWLLLHEAKVATLIGSEA
jgi:hypothetical protein